ncbi:YbaK family protein [Caldibacillus lycopersici]|uniref:YbaK family protein n=1 Tax=Perspicuibacillus lycopersici TaxID=1325689 RepID=A0AAE3IVW9_9BACI|nr:YbaK family protein [Perspicuibacillus lycopersici]MCU9615182.1 YbaK family protein [Perspicuibacillus lycopersici]
MNIDTSLMRRRREKQIKFERSVLRELSLEKLKKSVQAHFGNIYSGIGMVMDNAIEEGCYDVAVEAYILGSHYSRLGYYGEPMESIKPRSLKEQTNLAKALADFISYWSNFDGGNGALDESLHYKCEQYVDHWWVEGFTKGKMKYKMRMH